MQILKRFRREEEGQAIILVGLAMSLFLIAAVGLGIDGSHLYSQHQMAQIAADSAAQAAMMSIFNGTNTTGTAAFSTSKAITCSTSDAETPCVYARDNGFGGSSADGVVVSFPTSAPAGVTLSPDFAVNLVNVQVSRKVNTFLVRLAGATQTTVYANATAAIVSVVAPVPILINHPTLSGAFSTNGGFTVTICGGPHRSIQVNSSSSTATINKGASGTVDLQKAGPPDPGDCTKGTGADFGVWGGPSSPSFTFKPGTTGHYLNPASWMLDPLAGVNPPSNTDFPPQTQAGQPTFAAGAAPCPASAGSHGCTLLSPGTYASGLALKNTTAIFRPGIYYIQSGGFGCLANCNAQMATGYTDSPIIAGGTGGTGTTWDGTQANGGMLVYNTGSGQFNVGANGSASLIGSPAGSSYKGILFFEDRTAAANTGKNAHTLGGGGAMTLLGTIYMTNTRATMQTTSSHYQELDLSGTSGNSTLIEGEIIVDALGLGGNGAIKMNLNSNASLTISQVALVQ